MSLPDRINHEGEEESLEDIKPGAVGTPQSPKTINVSGTCQQDGINMPKFSLAIPPPNH